MKRKPPSAKDFVSPQNRYDQYLLCAHCMTGFTAQPSPTGAGRPPLYCSNACRLKAWRGRQKNA